MKRILVIGSGGREHALVWKLNQSPNIEKIFVAPGNGGTALMNKVSNVNIPVTEFDKLSHLAYKEDIALTIVGPDDPLALGIVDSFQSRGLKIWGPTMKSAQIEASKAFAKELMQKNNIPTAKCNIFRRESYTNSEELYNKCLEYIISQGIEENNNPNIVIKAGGLALGKGVSIVKSLDEAREFLDQIIHQRIFGEAGDEIIIEEFLDGSEISVHVFTDGKNYKILPLSKDHKAIYENNEGPNTGGMGTIAPLPNISHELLNEIEAQVIKPTLDTMSKAGIPFVGLLYPGLKLSSNGLKVLEFNARFGDPETQSYMRLLESDLLEIIEASVNGSLDKINILFSQNSAVTITLASEGYPNAYEKGFVISGIDLAEQDPRVVVFHAGTKLNEEGKIITNGGRVLSVTATGKDLEEALSAAYQAIDKINFQGKYYRKDIGRS